MLVSCVIMAGSVAEKQAYNVQLLQARQEKRSAARANPKAIRHDMNAAFTSMDREVGATCCLVICLHSLHVPFAI